MTRIFLAAGVAALAISAPVSAERPAKERGQKAERAQVQRSAQRQTQRTERRAQRPERQAQRQVRERQPQRAERRVDRTERHAQRSEQKPARLMRMEQRADRQQAERRQVRAERATRVEREARADRRERTQVRTAQVDRRQREQVRAARLDRRDVREIRNDRQEVRARTAARLDRQFRDQRIADRNDRRDFRIDRRDGDRFRAPARFADYSRARGLINGCPPGLFMKDNGCMPPGQVHARKLLGRQLPTVYRQSALPLSLRRLYPDNNDYYYRYGDGYLYRVNRRDNLIASLIPLLGGGYTMGQQFPSMYMNSFVPDYYRPFYRDNSDDYYRYANGYVYEIDRGSGFIEDMYPAYGYGYGVGQMFPAGYDYYNVPMQYRDYFSDNDDYYYRYAPGGIYQVDRGTNLITALASLMSPTGFAVGQPLPMGYDVYNVPYGYRDQYFDSPTSMYRYNNGYIYQVDPTTRLITAIISALV